MKNCKNCGNTHRKDVKEVVEEAMRVIRKSGLSPIAILMADLENDIDIPEVIAMTEESDVGKTIIEKFISEQYKKNWFKLIVAKVIAEDIQEKIAEDIDEDEEEDEDEE